MIRRLAFVIPLALAMAAPVFAENEALLERDDATARARARLLLYGERSPEAQLHILQEAQREAARYGIGASLPRSAAALSAPSSDAWVNVGPSDGAQISPVVGGVDSGRVRKIVAHPTDPNILYVATAGGGVWKTFSAQAPIGVSTGPRWFSITAAIGSQSVGAFALDPNSPDSLYLGLGDPFDVHTPGFYTSTDGGITWSGPVTLKGAAGIATSVRDIVVDPVSTGVVLAATDAGLFKSVEAGPWTSLDLGGRADCWSIASVGPSVWLVTCGGEVFRSVDGAASFAPSNTGLTGNEGRMTLAAAPSDRGHPESARVYLLAATSSGGEQEDVYYSNSGGQQWFSLGMVPQSVCGVNCKTFSNAGAQPDLDLLHGQAWYNQAILVDRDNRDTVFIGGNLNLARSRDGGQTWDLAADWLPQSVLGTSYLPYVHADHHAMAVQQASIISPKYFYAGTDGGIFRSSDIFTAAAPTQLAPHTITFENKLNRGIVSHLVYSVATDIHDSSNTVMLGGFQDNGTRERVIGSDGSGTLFDEMIGADGFGVGIGISNSSAAPASCRGRWGSLLIGTIYGTIWRSVDCGASFSVSMNGICQARGITTAFGQACDVDPGTNFFMKMASDQAAASGQVFVTVINNSTCDPARTTCTVPGVNTVYASSNGGALWAKANGTITLADGVSTASTFPDWLRFVGTNPNHAGHWAVNDFNYVYITLDSGAHWQQSAPLLGGVSAVAFEDATGEKIWASTRGGKHVFRSADRGAHWTDMSANLPDVPASTVAVDPVSSSTVHLGTEIGLYRTDDGGAHWTRAGAATLPMVPVTEISIALDGSAVRISTYGRGFWELNASATAPSGVHGDGDLDHNQVLDGFDVVREAALLGETPADPDYDPTGNLVGSTNAIDGADLAALVGRLGSRP